MKKHIILFNFLLLFILWSVNSLAEPVLLPAEKNEVPAACPPPIKLKDGYYIGVAAGYDVYKMKDSISYSNENIENPVIAKTNPELALNGMIGNFTFGYGRFLGKNSKFYMGAELFANGSAADTDFQTTIPAAPVIIDTDAIVNGSFGLALLPGISLNKSSMIYLKLGYNWSTVSLDETVRSEQEFEVSSIEYHDEMTINGIFYGVGIEAAFNDQFSLRSEYTHASYHSFTAISSARIAPSRNQYLLGLIYRFNS